MIRWNADLYREEIENLCSNQVREPVEAQQETERQPFIRD